MWFVLLADCNMSTQEGEVGSVGGVPNRTWTLRYTQPLSAQQPPDYQPNVYIPGMLSGYCTLKLVPRGELGELENKFSIFGKKKRSVSSYDPSLSRERTI